MFCSKDKSDKERVTYHSMFIFEGKRNYGVFIYFPLNYPCYVYS